MRNISKEYLLLFNTLTDAEDTLAQLHARLLLAQRRAEELYISSPDGTSRGAHSDQAAATQPDGPERQKIAG